MSIPIPCLCLIVDPNRIQIEKCPKIVDAAINGGVNMVQLRAKNLSYEDRLSLALDLKESTAGRAMFIINNDIELALTVAAHGVHFKESFNKVSERVASFTQPFVVGQSVHSLKSALKAENNGVDYVIAGTMYPSQSHPSKRPEGTRLLQEIVSSLQIPCLGIGGINKTNVGKVINMGAKGVAVIGAISDASNPSSSTKTLADNITTNYSLQVGNIS